MDRKIGDIITVKVKIVGYDCSDDTYECSHIDGSKETDTMYFGKKDIVE